MSDVIQDQDYWTKAPENVSAEGIAYVADCLGRKYHRGKPKEELVFEMVYYIPDSYTPSERATLVASLIVGLQRMRPIEGTPIPRFPDKISRAYLEEAREFLKSDEGRDWLRDKLPPASNRRVGMMRIGSSILVERMSEDADARSNQPSGNTSKRTMPEANSIEAIKMPMPNMSMSDRSSLMPKEPRGYGAMPDDGGNVGARDRGHGILKNKIFCVFFSCVGVAALIGFIML